MLLLHVGLNTKFPFFTHFPLVCSARQPQWVSPHPAATWVWKIATAVSQWSTTGFPHSQQGGAGQTWEETSGRYSSCLFRFCLEAFWMTWHIVNLTFFLAQTTVRRPTRRPTSPGWKSESPPSVREKTLSTSILLELSETGVTNLKDSTRYVLALS